MIIDKIKIAVSQVNNLEDAISHVNRERQQICAYFNRDQLKENEGKYNISLHYTMPIVLFEIGERFGIQQMITKKVL